ncbi:MAG: integrase arm-type DNA-binding domain-containing protein [Acetobacteraceae bacterium]|nr:integrase arm-type DNA-binding domain-containing protein [Acetobacteraceae bacterium]
MPKLTDKLLHGLALEPGQKDRLLFDTACPGLGVRLTTKGTRTFIAQWTDTATRRKVREPLGVWGSLTIDQAREAARVRLGQVAKGIDPRAEREQRRRDAERDRAETALTFRALIDEWAGLHLTHRRPRYAREAQRALHHAFDHLLGRPAARLSRAEAVNTLDALAKAGKAAMAGRTMAYARACFHWAEKRGKVPGNPFMNLPIPAGAVERERALTDEELGRVWGAAASMSYPWGPLFRLLLLTLARREEVAGMRWSELSPDLSSWTIPSARMKRGLPHVIALPAAAKEALAAIPRIEGQDLLFSTTGRTAVSGFTKAKAALDRASSVTDWRLHDIRRTGVSALAAMGIDSIVADKLLAHQPSKLRGAARVYQRHDFAAERASALQAWATHVLRCAEGGLEAGNIVALRRA